MLLRMSDGPLTRRERLRAQTLDEIQQRAFDLVDAEGAHAVSLAAIAKAMGMSAPALYRYYASRDALLAALVTAAYGDLSAAVERAAADHARRPPATRLRAATDAYRAWALAHPKRYTMLFGDRPDDVHDTTEAIATIDRGMAVLVEALTELHAEDVAPARRALDRQLKQWGELHDRGDVPARALRDAVLTWTRLHGIVALEIAGVFADMRLDAGLLLEAELDAIVGP